MKPEKRNRLKHKLHQDLGEDLDIELAWEDFRQKKRKKRFFPWWQYSGCLLIILGGLFAGIWLRPIANENSVVAIDSTKKGRKETSIIKPNSLENQAILSPKSAIELTAAKAEKIVSEKENTLAAIISSKNSISNDYMEINTTTFHPKKQQTINNPIQNKLTPFPIAKKDTLSLDELQPTKTIAKYNTQIPNTALTVLPKSTRLLEEVPTLFNSLTLLRIKATELPLFTPKPSTKPSLWEIGLIYQLSTVNRHLKGGNTSYNDRRNINENFLEANQLQIAIRRKIRPHFYLQSGVHIERYRAKIIDEFQTFEPKVFESQVVEIIRDGLTEENVIGDVTGTQENFYANIRFQQYIATSIPIQLGIQYPLTSALSVDFNTGVRLSVWHKHIGNTFQSASSIGTYQPISDLGYKTAGVITGQSSLSLSHKIGQYSKINLGIQAHYDLTNRLSTSEIGVDKFYGYGLQIGIFKQLRL